MKDILTGKVLVLLSGFTAWAAIVLLKGFTLEYISMLFLFVLLSETANERIFPYILGLSLVTILSANLMPWAVLTAGILSVVFCTSLRIRYIAFLAIVLTIWFSPLLKMIPFILLALSSFFVAKKYYKIFLVFLAVFLSVLWMGMPADSSPYVVYARSMIQEGRIIYQIPSLNLTTRKVLLLPPSEGNWALELVLDAGGVRDTIPMYSLQLGEDLLFLPMGKDTLCFTIAPGDTLVITLMRKFHPFNHPIVHATAEGELL